MTRLVWLHAPAKIGDECSSLKLENIGGLMAEAHPQKKASYLQKLTFFFSPNFFFSFLPHVSCKTRVTSGVSTGNS
jgi:hypothetical protein